MKVATKYPTKAILALLVLFFLLMSYTTFAGDGKNAKAKILKVRGVVIDEYGIPLQGAVVNLFAGEQLVQSVVTDKRGNYELKINNKKTFVIEIEKNCFVPKRVDMERAENEDGTKVYGYLMQVDMESVPDKDCKEEHLNIEKASVSINHTVRF